MCRFSAALFLCLLMTNFKSNAAAPGLPRKSIRGVLRRPRPIWGRERKWITREGARGARGGFALPERPGSRCFQPPASSWVQGQRVAAESREVPRFLHYSTINALDIDKYRHLTSYLIKGYTVPRLKVYWLAVNATEWSHALWNIF